MSILYYAEMKCDEYGWSKLDFLSLVELWGAVSRWDFTKGDPNESYGIPQACPGYKMESFGSDWETNYETQINWGLDYIRSRYRNPSKALEYFKKNNCY